MNAQLYAHLEAFENGDDSSEQFNDFSSSLDAATDDDDAKNAARIESPKSENSVDKHGKINRLIETSMIYVPIVLVVLMSSSSNGEKIAFLSIAAASLGYLVCRQQQWQPPSIVPGRPHQHSSLKLTDTPREKIEEEKNFSSAPPHSRYKKIEEDIYECRNELSRLLGLIGAPPMEGRNILNDSQTNFDDAEFDKGEIPGRTPIDMDLENSLADTTTSIVSFLEAHVQVILTIDKALYWVKISSSLHWGLGPHSQCVERVERAAMTKELFHARRRSAERKDNQSSSGNVTKTQTPTSVLSGNAKKVRMDQLQRRIDSSSILALSSARRNIAHVIVNEVNSIAKILGMLDNHDDHRAEDDLTEFIEMPYVIDITWMKASRKYLATLLAYCVDKFTTWESLRRLSLSVEKEREPLRALNGSMWNARNLREYLISHLLLDDDGLSRRIGCVHPISCSRGGDGERKYAVPLMEYQKQLDALDAALWSFQQYLYSQDVDSIASNPSNNSVMQDSTEKQNPNEDDPPIMALGSSRAKLTWWNQIKEISAACQALEENIGNKFFSSSAEDHGQNTEDEHESSNASVPMKGDRNTAHKAQSYEHIAKSPNEGKFKPTSHNTTKTLVFSGEGSKQKRASKKTKQKTTINDEGDSISAPMPIIRDAFAEHQLLRELQNRVRSVAALREEEEQVLGLTSQTEFEGTSGEDENQLLPQSAMKPGENSTDDFDAVFPKNTTGYQKTAITTNIFLGASGSLLEELKMNIISPADDIIENSEEETLKDSNNNFVTDAQDGKFFS